jgi:uncharacterized membrane protein YfcA
MEDSSTQINGVGSSKTKLPVSFWIWCGALVYFLLVLHNSSDFYTSFFTALAALILIEGIRWSRSTQASDILSRLPNKSLYDVITEPLLGIGSMLLAVAVGFYFLTFLLVPITCGIQSWFDANFLSTKVCTMQVVWTSQY